MLLSYYRRIQILEIVKLELHVGFNSYQLKSVYRYVVLNIDCKVTKLNRTCDQIKNSISQFLLIDLNL